MRAVITNAVDLLKQHVVRPEYPGSWCPSGWGLRLRAHHEELKETNEQDIMPCVIDLFGVLTWALETLRDEIGPVSSPGNRQPRPNEPQASREGKGAHLL